MSWGAVSSFRSLDLSSAICVTSPRSPVAWGSTMPWGILPVSLRVAMAWWNALRSWSTLRRWSRRRSRRRRCTGTGDTVRPVTGADGGVEDSAGTAGPHHALSPGTMHILAAILGVGEKAVGCRAQWSFGGYLGVASECVGAALGRVYILCGSVDVVSGCVYPACLCGGVTCLSSARSTAFIGRTPGRFHSPDTPPC